MKIITTHDNNNNKLKKKVLTTINTFRQESLHISIKGFTRDANDMCYVVTARLHRTRNKKKKKRSKIDY